MRPRLAPRAALNLILLVAMLAVGLPGIVASAIRLPSEVAIRALELGVPVDRTTLDETASRLAAASAWSNAARVDLALAMLAQGPWVGDRVAGDHAARQLRLYLASAPDDPLAWSNLALAEFRRGIPAAAVPAYKMGIELAPESQTYFVSRCGFGIDLYSALDDEGKVMLAHQCQMAMDPSLDGEVSRNLVEMAKRKTALPLARLLMAGNPQASRKFEAMAPSP